MKDEFVSVVSHELRTLTSIRGALGLWRMVSLTTQPEKGQRMLEIAVRNTDRLVRLTTSLISSTSSPVESPWRNRPAMQLMIQAADAMRAMADKVTLSVSPLSAQLWADPDRIIKP